MMLVSGATRTVRRLAGAPDLGVLFTPGTWGFESFGLPWGADNGCFAGFNESRYLAMLDGLHARRVPGCLFVVAPDVVANHRETRALFDAWELRLRHYGWPIAFVLQNGATVDDLPWGRFDVLFIGGDTAFKMSREAETMAGYAKARGCRVHVGRVNSRKRIGHFFGFADSFDGTQWSRFSETHLERGLGWIAQHRRQPRLI